MYDVIPYLSEEQLSRCVAFPLRAAPVGKIKRAYRGGLYGRSLPASKPSGGVPDGAVRRFPHAPRPYFPFERKPWQVVWL